MPISPVEALGEILLGDAGDLARSYYEIAVARIGEFETEDARCRFAVAVNAVGKAVDPFIYSTAYARLAGQPVADPGPHLNPVCNRCGSGELARDASVRWDSATQQWEVSGIYDSTTCDDCSAESDTLCNWIPCDPAGPPMPSPLCRHCGSPRIVLDAAARWDEQSGQWNLSSVQDCAFCDDCERDGDDLIRWSPAEVAPGRPPAGEAK